MKFWMGPLFDEASADDGLAGAGGGGGRLSTLDRLNALPIPGEPVPEPAQPAQPAQIATPEPGEAHPAKVTAGEGEAGAAAVESASPDSDSDDPFKGIDPDAVDFDAKDEEKPEVSAAAKEGEPQPAEKKATGVSVEEYIKDEKYHDDPEINDKIRGAFLSTGRGQRMLAADVAFRELSAPVEQGGLGFTPKAEDIKNLATDARAHARLIHDLDNFDQLPPERASQLTGWLFGTAENPSPVAAHIATTLPAHLARTNPQALQALEHQVMNAHARRFEALSKQGNDPSLQKFYANLAGAIKYTLDPNQQQQQRTAPAAGAANNAPSAEVTRELEALRRERAELQQQRQTQEQQQFTSYMDQFLGDADNLVGEMITKVFTKNGSNALEAYAPKFLEPYLANQRGAVLEAVLRDEDFHESLNAGLRRSFQSASPRDREQALADVRRRAEVYVRQVTRNMIEDLRSAPRLQQPGRAAEADATRVAYEQQKENRAPAGGGGTPAGAPGASNGLLPRQPGEDAQAWIQRNLGQLTPAGV